MKQRIVRFCLLCGICGALAGLYGCGGPASDSNFRKDQESEMKQIDAKRKQTDPNMAKVQSGN